MSEMLNRARGVLVGVTVGDCVGAPFEFKPGFAVRVLEIDQRSVFGHGVGCGTDDSETTWAVADAYLSASSDDQIVVRAGETLLAWLATGPKDVGGTTRQGLRAFAAHRDPARSGVTASEANGSLMRCSPTAIARHGDDPRAVREAHAISALTHASPVCLDSCAVYVRIVSALIDGVSIDDAIRIAQPTTRAIADALVAARDCPSVDAVHCAGTGHVVYAFTLAIWALLHTTSFEEGITAVVCAGGDTDTNAAIAGAVLGAHYGYDAIPRRWTNALVELDAILIRADAIHALRDKP